jgi:hypothetical protein
MPYAVDNKANTFAIAPPAAPVRRSRSGTILISIAVLVLVPLLAASVTLGLLYINGQIGKTHTTSSITPQALNSTPGVQSNPTTTLPDPSSFKDTEDSINTALKASLKYPSDWQVGPIDTSTDGVAILPMFSQQTGIQMYIQRIAEDPSQPVTPEQLNQIRLQTLSQKYSGVQAVDPQNAKPTIGGIQWEESDATFPDPQSSQASKIHFTSIIVLRNNFYYAIHLFIADNVFQPAMQKYFQPIFDSFKFLA